MFNKKPFWYGTMTVAVAAWPFIFAGAICPFGGGLRTFWLTITLVWGISHPLELVLSVPIARKAGFSMPKTIVFTLIFGITWWLPVKLGVLTAKS